MFMLRAHPIQSLCAFAALAVVLVAAEAPSLPLVTASIPVRPPAAAPAKTNSASEMPRLRQAVPVDILRVIDGDTVEVRAHVWLDQTIVTRVRLKSIDAPELRSGCPLELAKAEAARAKLAAMLGEGPAFLTGLARDKYGGRVLGQLVTASGEDAGARMLAGGHARAYGGGKRASWC